MKTLLPSLGLALALKTVTAITGTSTTSHCITLSGPKSITNPPSTEFHLTKTLFTISKTTIRDTKIITSPPQTTTWTTTEIETTVVTETPLESTVEVKTTIFGTITFTAEPSVSTIQTTVQETTTVQPTVTAALPGGFTPVQSSLPTASLDVDINSPAKRSQVRRDNSQPDAKMENRAVGLGSLLLPHRNWYPQSVRCRYTTYVPKVIVQTKTGRPVTITMGRTMVIETSTTVITSTSTVFGSDVTVSVTATTSSVITSTLIPTTGTTVTVTNTNTVELPAETYYPQCEQSNFANRGQGGYLVAAGVRSPADVDADFSLAATPHACCVACAARANCISGIFNPHVRCELILSPGGSCTASSPCYGYAIAITQNFGYSVTFFNGPVFQWNEVQRY